jgi:xylulokinase
MFLAFDIGTSSVKTALYDAEGRMLHQTTCAYDLDTPQAGWCELNPEVYWASVLQGFARNLHETGVDARAIQAIAGASQGETVILLDAAGDPVYPAIVWLDNRAQQEADDLREEFDAVAFYEKTGIPRIDSTWSICKLLWTRKRRPRVWKRCQTILLVEDYIVYRLTGQRLACHSLWSTTGLMDLQRKTHWAEAVNRLGVSDKLPPIVEEGAVVGPCRPDVAEQLGLSRSTVVIKGTMDQTMAAFACGNVRPGIATITIGSALALAVATDHRPTSGGAALPFQTHIVPDSYLCLPFVKTAGMALKWFRDQFGGEEIKQAADAERSFAHLDAHAAAVPPGAEGLVFLPFLAGASFPKPDDQAMGVFYGVLLKHAKGHFIRAILEGVGYELKRLLDYIATEGVAVGEIRAMGGGARSDLWLQVMADICQTPIRRMKNEEATLRGGALLCATRCGQYASLREAAETILPAGAVFRPHMENAVIYSENWRRYEHLREQVAPLFHAE